ncbi:MAG: hypothetical protein ACHQ9S_18265 [Candidatus Binatia bacterium]
MEADAKRRRAHRHDVESHETKEMSALAPSLVTASAAMILLLGLVHLLYTFRGRKLHPRDAELEARLRAVSPVISRETTMWKAWVGFNASHSFGAILFGSVYGYLAVVHSTFLFQSWFLLLLGLLHLAGYVFLGKVYWFSTPFRGIVLAAMLYVAALIVRWA